MKISKRQHDREYHAKNREKRNAQRKARRAANREQERQRGKEYFRANPEKYSVWRRIGRLRRYGLTLSQYDSMFALQGGLCAICRNAQDGGNLNVDHRHSDGKVRGLLCHNCNRAIGLLKDDPDIAYRASLYLCTEVQLRAA